MYWKISNKNVAMNIFLGNIDIITVFIICLGFISEHLEQQQKCVLSTSYRKKLRQWEM